MREKLQEEAGKTLISSRFEKLAIECHNTVPCSMYLRNAERVLREQVSEITGQEFIHRSYMVENFLHISNDEVRTRACAALDRYINCSEDGYVSWRTADSEEIMLTVVYLQIFSYKSQMSLPAGTLQFYPNHRTLLNF